MSTIERTELLIGQRRQEQLPINALELPGIDDVLTEFGNLGPHKILMGVSRETGEPVILDLLQVRSIGSMIILGDKFARKASFLQNFAYQISKKEEFVPNVDVLSRRPIKWNADWVKSSFIRPLHHEDIPGVSRLLSTLMHEYEQRIPRPSVRSTLLLIDNLPELVDSISVKPDLITILRFLCEKGPSVGIVPIATMNGSWYEGYAEWGDMFPLKIFGAMQNVYKARRLGCDEPEAVQKLTPGIEFRLQRARGGLNFWLPLVPR